MIITWAIFALGLPLEQVEVVASISLACGVSFLREPSISITQERITECLSRIERRQERKEER